MSQRKNDRMPRRNAGRMSQQALDRMNNLIKEIMFRGEKAVKITKVMIQFCPHLDSLVALWLLTKTEEGRRMYPGIENAEVDYWGTGTLSPDGRTWQQYLEGGTVLIGVGGSPFDEHPSKDFGDRKREGLSATMLMAQHLGIDSDSLYRKLVEETTVDDLEPSEIQNSFASIIKSVWRMPDLTNFQKMEFAFTGIASLVERQYQYLEAIDELGKTATIKQATVPDGGRRVLIGFIKSNNILVRAASRREPRLAVLVQQRTTGNTNVFSNHDLGVKMHKIAAAIRHAEMVKAGREKEANAAQDQLGIPGLLEIMPNWAYVENGEDLHNGTETAPLITPTKLTEVEIMTIVRENLVLAPHKADPPEGDQSK